MKVGYDIPTSLYVYSDEKLTCVYIHPWYGKQIFYLYSMVTVDIKLNIIRIVGDVIIRINFMGLESTGNDLRFGLDFH